MKLAGTFLLAVLVMSVIFVAGCVQETGPTGGTAGDQLTQAEVEQQAYSALDQEMEQSIDQMKLEDIENELLNQG